MCIHLTGPAGKAARAAANSEGKHDDSTQLPSDSGAVTYHTCRPDVEAAFGNLPDGNGGFAFACGPSKLQELTVRYALKHRFHDVHTETFEF